MTVFIRTSHGYINLRYIASITLTEMSSSPGTFQTLAFGPQGQRFGVIARGPDRERVLLVTSDALGGTPVPDDLKVGDW